MVSFVETKLFTRLVQEYLSEAEYAEMQSFLIEHPEAGDIIPGSGGVRKLRWRAKGRGKRGGLRRSTMPKTKRNIGNEILAGLREIKRGEHGRVITVPSVSSIRERTGLSQTRFAQVLGVSVRTLQDWEQGRRAPSGAARTLLMVAAKNPRVLLDVA